MKLWIKIIIILLGLRIFNSFYEYYWNQIENKKRIEKIKKDMKYAGLLESHNETKIDEKERNTERNKGWLILDLIYDIQMNIILFLHGIFDRIF